MTTQATQVRFFGIDRAGQSVHVYLHGTTTHATIYGADGVTPIPNPTPVTKQGFLNFSADPGTYDCVADVDGAKMVVTITPPGAPATPYVAQTSIGVASGVAPLDANALVPVANLPISAATLVLAGVGVPDNSLGLDGDYYWDEATGDIYGPKAIGAWGAIVTTIAYQAKLNSAYGAGQMETGAIAETMSRKNISNAGITKGSGVFRGPLVELPAGEVITSLSFWTSATAMAGATHQWFAVLDATGKVLAVSADDTSNAWAANSKKTLPLTSPLTIPARGGYYLGNCIVATTMPTFFGQILTAVPGGSTPFVNVSIGSQVGPPAVNSILTPLGQNTSMEYGFAS